jgi:hypothetical protein
VLEQFPRPPHDWSRLWMAICRLHQQWGCKQPRCRRDALSLLRASLSGSDNHPKFLQFLSNLDRERSKESLLLSVVRRT